MRPLRALCPRWGWGDATRCSSACHRDAGWCSPKEGNLLMLIEILL